MKIPEILLVETVQRPGSLASVLAVIAEEQLVIEHLQSLRRDQGRTLWEITVEIDEAANPQFYARIDALPNARFVGKSDRVLNRHRGGKISTATWNRRYREYMEKIKTGSLVEIASVLRDLCLLRSDKELSFGERKMLDTARSLLVQELALAKGQSEELVARELDELF